MNQTDSGTSGEPYAPEWDLVGVDATAGDPPGGREAAPPLPVADSEAPNIAYLFTAANPNGSRSRQRGSLFLCFDDASTCCSASFLNNASILTAAHCLPQPNRNALHNVSLHYELPGGGSRDWHFNNVGTRPGDPFCPDCRDGRMFFYPHPSTTVRKLFHWAGFMGRAVNAPKHLGNRDRRPA